MTREDIIRMAREAGLTVGTNISGVMLVGSPSTPGIAHIDIDEMACFAALVAAAEREKTLEGISHIVDAAVKQEREECAKVCEEWGAWNKVAQDIAEAIRARQ